MEKTRTIKYIVVHCTASAPSKPVMDLMREWNEKGWKHPGYHYVVTDDARVYYLLREELPANGVKGHNMHSVHVAYTGGLGSDGRPSDTLTPGQFWKLCDLLTELSVKYPDAKVCGHRDLSPDADGDGEVEPHEWLKLCPCFNVKEKFDCLKIPFL